jgi:hypothetical protein
MFIVMFIFIDPCIGDWPPIVGFPMPPLDCCESDGRVGMFMRCCCSARAFAIISMGSAFALALAAGLRALFRAPVTLELDSKSELFWGSETVRSDGTRRGASPAPSVNPEPNGDGTASEPELMAS